MRGSLNTTRIVVVTSTTGNARTNTRVARLRRTPTAKPHQPRAPATFEELGTVMVGVPDRGVKENMLMVDSAFIEGRYLRFDADDRAVFERDRLGRRGHVHARYRRNRRVHPP